MRRAWLWRLWAVGWAVWLGTVSPAWAQEAASPPAAAAPSEASPAAPSEAPAAEAPRDGAPDESGTPEGRTLGDYVKHGLLGMPVVTLFVEDDPYHPKVQEGAFVAGWLGAIFAWVGGHIWAPALFYGDAPDSTAATRARVFGMVSVVAAWAAILSWPLLFIPVVGWAAFIGIVIAESIYQWDVAPRMIALAYSDAWAGGGGSALAGTPSREDAAGE